MPVKPAEERSRVLAVTCWIPVASLVAIELYARNFDGWGAWATAPLFLVPLVLGLAIGAMGAVQSFAELREGSLRTASIVWAGVALLPLLWLAVRRHVT